MLRTIITPTEIENTLYEGQLEFTRGAYMSKGGKAFICLHSTRPDKDGEIISNIVPILEPGDMVTVPATDVSYIVSEYGIVNLKGKGPL